jgi:hypothetical protein
LLPSQSRESSGSSTLPNELNPLSNQLLAENLRRWAEVYFSNPPERREQAISELLRELQEQRAQQHIVASGTASVARPEPGSIFPAANPAPSLVRCRSCGHENDVSAQRFCGMCGVVVGVPEPSTYSQFDESSRQDWETKRSAGTGDQEAEESWESESDSVPAYEEIAPSTHELSLFQAVPRGSGHDDPVWEYDTSPSPPYRLYIGLVLAVMLVGLGYLAWRGVQGNSPSHQVSAPPPAVAKDADTAAAQAPTPKAEQEATPPKNAAQAAPSGVASKPERKVAGNSRSQPTLAAETEPMRALAGAGSGEQELSIAERYLSGADGKRRDTAEASQWLWKSVAKHNDKAAVLLADLYLKGDGVSKNCEQARVLLDSAARKGTSGAGERLRNLQAFGCQ